MAATDVAHIELDAPRRRLLLGCVMVVTFAYVLDSTVVAIALDIIQGSLSAAPDQVTELVTFYILAEALGLPVGGWLAVRFGRRPVLLWSVAMFTASSVLCGWSSSLDFLVFARVLQGFSGAALIPISQSLLLDVVPKSRHGPAIAAWSMVIMAGPVLGPVLGAWMAETHGWPSIFFINLPLGVIAWVGIRASLWKDAPQARPFDVRGALFLAMVIVGLLWAMENGFREGWLESLSIQASLAMAFLGACWFYLHAQTHPHPFVDLKLARDRNFGAALMFQFLLNGVLYSSTTLLPLYLQQSMGYPVSDAAWLILPRSLATIAALYLAGHLLGRGMPPRLLLFLGLVMVAGALGWMSQLPLDPVAWPVVATGLLQGLGLGLSAVPASTMAYSTLDPTRRTEATALYGLARNLGGSLATSLLLTMVWQSAAVQRQDMTGRLDERWLEPWFDLGLGAQEVLGALQTLVAQQALASAQLHGFLVAAALCGLALPLVLMFKPVKK